MVSNGQQSQSQKTQWLGGQLTPTCNHGLLSIVKKGKRHGSQKQSSNKKLPIAKTEALYVEHREQQKKAEESEQATKAFEEQGDKILLRIARIATGTSVRWKREVRANDQ